MGEKNELMQIIVETKTRTTSHNYVKREYNETGKIVTKFDPYSSINMKPLANSHYKAA